MPTFQVLAIGNAIIDTVTPVNESFLAKNQLEKGTLALIDEETSHYLYDQIKPLKQKVGGSASNSLSGITSLGGTSAFIGRVKNDGLGKIFCDSVKAEGIFFNAQPSSAGPGTGSCLVFVTPDGERTMRTFLGASVDIQASDVNEDLIKQSQILLIEAYLFDPPHAFEANKKAAHLAKSFDKTVVLSTSDVICVQKFRAELINFAKSYADILITNKAEVMALCETQNLDAAVEAVRNLTRVTVITCGDEGSIIVSGEKTWYIGPAPVETVLDVTGAGDLYAGGFLYGYAMGHDLPLCGRIGTLAAAAIIEQYGARPEQRLEELLPRLLNDPHYIKVSHHKSL